MTDWTDNMIIRHELHPVKCNVSQKSDILLPFLEHCRADFERLPYPTMLLEIAIECAKHGIKQKGFESLLKATADLYQQPAQRCGGCLGWFQQFHTGVIGTAEQPVVVALCGRCFQRMRAGKLTRAMKRNLQSYAEVGR